MLLGWSIVIVLITDLVLIGIVGIHTGITLVLGGVTDPWVAFRAGYRARVNFFSEFEIYIQFSQGVLVFLLAVLGKLPLTTRSD